MKELRLRLLKITIITLLIIFSSLGILVFFTGPDLPSNTDEIIEEVLTSKLPEFVKGKSGFVIADGHKIWYESLSPKNTNRGAVLLFMGIANDALAWPQKFIDNLSDSGYQVIRFDYRGTGMSDWIDNWQEKPYALADLAKDAKIILDTLKIEKAHLVGLSLGGMVAQEFAIRFSNRTTTLTSIMSSGFIMDRELPVLSKSVIFNLIKLGIKYGMHASEKNIIKLHLAARIVLRGDAKYDLDVKSSSEQILYNIRKRKGYNFKSSAQHQEATYRSGSRYEMLKKISMPVLLIHGMKDPFIPIEHSKKLASLIKGAKTHWIPNMGHDLPGFAVDSICKDLLIQFKNI